MFQTLKMIHYPTTKYRDKVCARIPGTINSAVELDFQTHFNLFTARVINSANGVDRLFCTFPFIFIFIVIVSCSRSLRFNI